MARGKTKYNLTDKQIKFCHEYIIDWNGSRACREAGYSEKAAKETASELLTKSNIQDYIKEIQKDLEKEAGLSKLMAINQLRKFAFHGFYHIHNTWIDRKDFEDLPKDVIDCIQEIDTRVTKKAVGDKENPEIIDVEQVKIKLVDKRLALQDLSKMLGWNEPDKIDVKSEGIIFENVSEDYKPKE